MKKYYVLIMALTIAIIFSYFIYANFQKNKALSFLKSEYGYSTPPYEIKIEFNFVFTKATAKIEATNINNPIRNWKVDLEKSHHGKWKTTFEQGFAKIEASTKLIELGEALIKKPGNRMLIEEYRRRYYEYIDMFPIDGFKNAQIESYFDSFNF